MDRLRQEIAKAGEHLNGLLDVIIEQGSMSLDQYHRYLSMQYHLTYGVQKVFLICAGHHSLARFRKLREFLVEFAFEEEMHYLLAEKDIRALGLEPLPCPLDVELWQVYFEKMIHERPFVRLGAASVLENIATACAEKIDRVLSGCDFISPKTAQFIIVHKHEELPHGEAILEALAKAYQRPEIESEIVFGANVGRRLFGRMLEWALTASDGMDFHIKRVG